MRVYNMYKCVHKVFDSGLCPRIVFAGVDDVSIIVFAYKNYPKHYPGELVKPPGTRDICMNVYDMYVFMHVLWNFVCLPWVAALGKCPTTLKMFPSSSS